MPGRKEKLTRAIIAVVMRNQLDVELHTMSFESFYALKVSVATTDPAEVETRIGDGILDLIVVDPDFSRGRAVELIENLQRNKRIRRALLLGYNYNALHAAAASELFAGYCVRTGGLKKLLSCIDRLLSDPLICPTVENGLIERSSQLRFDTGKKPILTERQLEVLSLLAEGKTVVEAAKILGVSPSTIDNHRSRLMNAIGHHKNTELVRWAIRNGIIDP